MTAFDPASVQFDKDGLVPAIVQDDRTGAVLMLGYMSEESLRLTLQDALVTFWSRSRRQLWRKGATSGNFLHLIEVSIDCDGDAILITAKPDGPACHTGSRSCFDAAHRGVGFDRLERLWSVIADRAATKPEGSYTAQLVAGGVNATSRKLTEEATEVLLAAKDHAAGLNQDELAEEAADLLYHLFVVLAERGESPASVLDVLDRRS